MPTATMVAMASTLGSANRTMVPIIGPRNSGSTATDGNGAGAFIWRRAGS